MSEETIFALALEQPNAATRAAVLADACGTDAALRQRVEGLLEAHEKVGDFLNKPVVERLVAAPEGSDATQAFNGSTNPQGLAMPRTEGLGSSDEQETPLDFLEPSARPDSLGRIGHYEVLQILGQGGFGIVFRAFDEVLQRVVALKVLAPAIASTSPARKRFLREARSSAQVRHDNVVQTYAVEEKPVPYLVMEFIPGETLQQRLDRVGPLDVTEILRLGRQIAEGLSAAHATDLIHRDIKPGNVLLEGGNLRVKITDFGLARAADDASMTRSGVLAGTPMYMAPEQANGDALDHRADLFSLGSVLYQMTTGRPPFRATSTLAVLKRVAEDTPRPIREVIPETPQWLCDIISKLHAKKPENRFQSAREVADLLGDCEAKLKAKQELKYALPVAVKPAGRKWMAAAALVLLPVIALAVTEFAGVTHLFRPQTTIDPTRSGVEPAAVVVAKNEIPVPMANSAPLPPTFTNRIGMEFVIVPKGKSWLGGGKDKLGDKEVVIPADFYLGKYLVTQEEWEKVMGEHTSFFSRNGGARDTLKNIPDAELKRFPVETVTWDQCQIFAAKLNKLEKETGWVYRLPTAVEWEYACRGGPMVDKADSSFDFYFAEPTNTSLLEQTNFSPDGDGKGGLARTCRVGSYKPNKLGLYDMHGNVWEWCDDSYEAGDASRRVVRGGSWGGSDWEHRAATRQPHQASDASWALGLRLARIPFGAPSPEAKTPSLAVAPFTDADVQRIAALPAEQQVEEVRQELMRRNPGFDGKMEHKIEDGVVTEFRIVTDQVTDIAPIRVFSALRELVCHGTWTKQANGQLANLTPLEGMNLASLRLLNLGRTKVTDAGMVYFRDCNDLKALYLDGTKVTDAGMVNFKDCTGLTSLRLDGTKVTDRGLVHFQDCKDLTYLNLSYSQVSDVGLARFKDCKNLKELILVYTQMSDAGLTQLKGMALKKLAIHNTGFTDLTPLQGMPLEKISLTPKNITRGLDVLREMKSLETIGIEDNQSWPAAEFWERYDKGEFGKAAAPFTDADVQRIAALPAAEQVEEVRKELMRRNPGFDGTLTPTVKNDVVTGLRFLADEVVNVAPVRALRGLTSLDCRNTQNKGKLSDLSPLRGMPLSALNLRLCTQIEDLTPLKDMPLTALTLSHCRVRNLEPLQGMPLISLYFDGCEQVQDLRPLKGMPLVNLRFNDNANMKDLEPLRGMPLKGIHIQYTSVTDLSPLKGMQLEDIRLTPKRITQGLDILRDMKSLKTIGISWETDKVWPAAEFWERYDRGEFSSPAAVAPFADADVQRIAALPAAEQVEEVRKELVRRNPGFDGTVEHKIKDGVVTEIKVVTDKVTDIAPIRVWSALRVLECPGTWTDRRNGILADLTPLKGMNLADLTHLNLIQTKVTDAGMSCFKDCKELRYLNLNRTKVSDEGLAHFKNCRDLTILDLNNTKVTDVGLANFKDCKKLTHLLLGSTKVSDAGLAQFKGMSLAHLWICDTAITDLSPLQDMPLEEIRLTPKNITRGLEILRDRKSLKTIGIAWDQDWPAAEFWARYDKGEFKE